MNKRGIELAISTLILIILGIVILVGLVYMLTGGFKSFKIGTDNLLSSQASSIKEACKLSCTVEDKVTFCCKKFILNNQNITCSDKKLDVSCSIDCKGFSC